MFFKSAYNPLWKEKQHYDHQKAGGKNVQLRKAEVGPKDLVNGDKDDGAYHRTGYRTLTTQDGHEDQFRSYDDVEENDGSQECQVVTPKPAGHTDE